MLRAGLSAASITPGDTVIAEMGITNERPEPVGYAGGGPGCPIGEISVVVPALAIDPGRSWPGDAGPLKSALIGQGQRVPLGERPGRGGCDATGMPSTLAPGETILVHATWRGVLASGYPAPVGDYQVAFRFLAMPPGRGDVPLETTLPIRVLEHESALKPGEALDLAFGEPRVAAWLTDHPRETWSRMSFTYDLDGRAWSLLLEAGPEEGPHDALMARITEIGHVIVSTEP